MNTNIGYWEQVLHAPTPAYNVSEQYSKEEIEQLAVKAGLKAADWQKVGTLAYIATLKKV